MSTEELITFQDKVPYHLSQEASKYINSSIGFNSVSFKTDERLQSSKAQLIQLPNPDLKSADLKVFENFHFEKKKSTNYFYIGYWSLKCNVVEHKIEGGVLRVEKVPGNKGKTIISKK